MEKKELELTLLRAYYGLSQYSGKKYEIDEVKKMIEDGKLDKLTEEVSNTINRIVNREYLGF